MLHRMHVLDIFMPFARTGRIGAVRIGVQLEDAARVLGSPWARGSSTGADGLPYLYAYGCLEVGICHAFTTEDVEEPALCNVSVADHRPHSCG